MLTVLALKWLHVLFRALVTTWALGAVSVTNHTVHTIGTGDSGRLLLTNAVKTSWALGALVLSSVRVGTSRAGLGPVIGSRVTVKAFWAVEALLETANWSELAPGTSSHDDTVVFTWALIANWALLATI